MLLLLKESTENPQRSLGARNQLKQHCGLALAPATARGWLPADPGGKHISPGWLRSWPSVFKSFLTPIPPLPSARRAVPWAKSGASRTLPSSDVRERFRTFQMLLSAPEPQSWELCCHSPYSGLLSAFQGHLDKLRPRAQGDGGEPAAPWEGSYSLGGLWAYMKCSRLPRAPLCLPSPLGMAWTPNGCCIS